MASQTHDDGFHEIQLNGKQLVFLFMAATLAGVVIFLAGVWTGRDVRSERAAQAQEQLNTEAPTADAVQAGAPQAMSTVEATVDPKTPPPETVDDPTDPRLADARNKTLDPPPAVAPVAAAVPVEKAAAPVEKKIVPEPKAVTPAPARTAAPTPPAKTAVSAAAAASPPAAGSGFVVQVAAFNVRSEADAAAQKLTSKGYSAYVQSPSNGATSVFRVRVGAFKTRREAESIAAKLEKEEQIKPWVTR